MFKLVVLCAFLAAVVAEPGVLLGAPLAAPLAYSSTVYSPATTTITKQASSVVHPSPYYGYAAPLAYSHYIKKRSLPLALGGYYAPTSYIASAPLATTAYTAPLITSAPYYTAPALSYAAPAHFIKKRSVAALALPSTYIAPATYAAAAPLITSASYYTTPALSYAAPALSYAAPALSYAARAHFIKKRSVAALALPSTYIAPATYAAAPLLTSAYAATGPIVRASTYIAPFGYSHFIKKRSAPLLASAYLAPTSYSTQSRIDVQHSAPLYTSYSTPLAYSRPFAYSHVY